MKAVEVARWFINRAIFDANNNQGEYMSPLKLQKLLYYAQGGYGAMYGDRLFDEEIEHWMHGPVIREIYDIYKSYGAGCIDKEEACGISDNKINGFLQEVYEIFGKFSAWGLRDMTHSHTVWVETKDYEVMEFDKIKQYFKKAKIVIA